MSDEGYRLFGLSVRSELPLPLPHQAIPSRPDVEVVCGTVSHGTQPVWSSDQPYPFLCTRDADRIVLDWSGMRFDVSAERVIVDTDAPDAAVIPLLQATWSVLLTIRGREALHASVLARDGLAVAISGVSGSGKSTAALALLEAGWMLVSDDLMTLDDRGCVVPGPPFIRLMPDRADGRAGNWDASGKLRYTPSLCTQPAPLSFVLVHGDNYTTPTRLPGVTAVESLIANIYNDVLMLPGQSLRRLDFALALAERVPIYGVPPRSLTPDLVSELSECHVPDVVTL